MRLWSIHPQYLDRKGLLALWRESLLALAVLKGETKGYLNHPQLIRFRQCNDPISAILEYLSYVKAEAEKRKYHFKEIDKPKLKQPIKVKKGQLKYELSHLLKKLETRDYERFLKLKGTTKIISNSQFKIINGDIEDWEKTSD